MRDHESSDGDGRSPSGIGIVSRLGDGRYKYPPLLCLECGGRTVSEPVIGIWVVIGVSDWRPPIIGRGLLLLLTAGAPCAGATCWVSSEAGAGVAGCVMGLYEPLGVIR